VFEAFFQMFAEYSETALLIQFFDSTTARAHDSAAGAKGGSSIRHSSAHVAGSRPRSTIRPISTVPLDFHLTPGQVSDSTETSLDIGPDIRPRIAVTEKAAALLPATFDRDNPPDAMINGTPPDPQLAALVQLLDLERRKPITAERALLAQVTTLSTTKMVSSSRGRCH